MKNAKNHALVNPIISILIACQIDEEQERATLSATLTYFWYVSCRSVALPKLFAIWRAINPYGTKP